jgi:HEAT repeat protein
LSPLQALWLLSLAICGLALLIMLSLLLGRLLMALAGRSRESQRKRLMPLLLGAREGRLDRRVSDELLARLSVELIHLVRGSDREKFVETATRMRVPERLRHQLDSGSARVRLAAAEALAQFPDARSIARLEAALTDPVPAVRLSAALSLAAAGHAPPVADLVARLRIGSEENSLLVTSLFRDIAADRPGEVKALVLDEDAPPGARAAAVEALAASGDYSLVPVLATLALRADGDDPFLPRYMAALGAFGHPAGEAAVKRGLYHPDPEVRAAAADAAGRIGLDALAPRLGDRLGDDDWWVRFRAGAALARMGAPGLAVLRAAAAGAEPAATAASLTMAERGLA